jgi:hypothetical protein
MTSATDVLQRLLDERGVEYVVDEEYGKKYPPEKRVTWSCDLAGEDMTVTARDYCIGINEDGSGEYCLDLEFHEVFTVEQAIAATLGTGTCQDLGGTGANDEQVFNCSECGCVLSLYDRDGSNNLCTSFIFDYPRYCPECGRKVVCE